ncbi:MAG: hypothetical protein Q9202_001040 [Teloschistes flavicans]
MVDFRSLVHEQLSRLEPGSKSDLLRKYTCLLVFDFEAAARLQSWASFENLIIAPSDVIIAALQVRTVKTQPTHLELIKDSKSSIAYGNKIMVV